MTESLVPFLGENQGYCGWVFKLDGSDNPPVIIRIGDDPQWHDCCNHFSTFVYCQVWDYAIAKGRPTAVEVTTHLPVPDETIRDLFKYWQHLPRTF